MTRRQFDSSKTRVVPVFNELLAHPAGWLTRLLDLASGASDRPRPWSTQDLTIIDTHWGDNERRLPPPTLLLEWLVRNVTLPPGESLIGNSDTDAARRRLLARDEATTEAALELLRVGGSSRGWHVLEGPSYPDAFIETRDALVVVEGKRTESGPTTTTQWMSVRHQMLRHLDAAWEVRGARSLYGVLIVEADPSIHLTDVPSRWGEAARATVSDAALDGSLPHRSADERRSIADCFVGVTTWQRVVEEFGLPSSVLPERVKTQEGVG